MTANGRLGASAACYEQHVKMHAQQNSAKNGLCAMGGRATNAAKITVEPE